MSDFIYKGPSHLLEAAEKRGLIFLEDKKNLNTFLMEKMDEPIPSLDPSSNALPIRVLNMKGLIAFLKDVNVRTNNQTESDFTSEMIFVFEKIDEDFEVVPNEDTPPLEAKIKTKSYITDEGIEKLKTMNTIDELLDPKNGFF